METDKNSALFDGIDFYKPLNEGEWRTVLNRFFDDFGGHWRHLMKALKMPNEHTQPSKRAAYIFQGIQQNKFTQNSICEALETCLAAYALAAQEPEGELREKVIEETIASVRRSLVPDLDKLGDLLLA